jgi:hypothetical protein
MTGRGSATGAPADFDTLPIGARIGRYEVKGVLGQGGFGITYLAFDAQLGRDVAIKEYLPGFLAVRRDGASVHPRSAQMADDFAWGRERFVAEARTLASLHDAPGIVRVHDFLEANGTAYMVMEWLRGRTLEDVLSERGRLDPGAVAALLEPLLAGLERVHDAGFLHRDIKPANILLGADGTPTLIDFGASRTASVGKTSGMTAVFSPGYGAPEQITSARQGPWTDIYALSSTLYRAITGALPPSAFDRVLDDAYEPVACLAPVGFAPALLAAIDAGLAVRPGDRPPSIAAWRQLLRQAPSAPPGDAPTVLMRPATADRAPALREPAPRPRRLLLQVGAGVVLASIAGVATWFVLGDRLIERARGSAAAEIASLRHDVEDARRSATAEATARRQAEQALASAGAEQRAAEKKRVEAEREASATIQRLEEERKKASEQPRPAAAPEPPVAPAWMNGTYAGALTTSTGGGPFLSMAFNATVTVANGQVVGQISERTCGAFRFTAPLAPSGEFTGSVRFPEDASCSSSIANVTGKISDNQLKVEIRAPRLKVYASLKKKS